LLQMIRSLMLLALVWLRCVALPETAAGAAAEEVSLYSAEDNVKMLNNATLERELRTSANCKLVQFINYFCGDCRRFAPVFKQLAARLRDWQRVLSIFVVDCAQERNVQICRDFNIRQTPTLRFFPPYFQRTEQRIGQELNTLEPDEIYSKLSALIAEIKYTTAEQPNFQPIESTNDTRILPSCSTHSPSYMVLVYQPAATTIGRDTILALLTWPTLVVRRVKDRRSFGGFGLSPNNNALAIVDCAGNSLYLHPYNETSTEYAASVKQYLESLGHTTMEPPSAAPNSIKYLPDEEQSAIIATVLQGFPRVYRADLEQAIDKLLHIELPKVRHFQGDNLQALQQLLNVLRRFSPLNASGSKLLQQLYEFVRSIGSSGLTGVAFQLQVESLERRLPKVFKARRYVGCISSGPFQRGFTCSLWTLFHFLTVQTANSMVLPAGAVLQSIHGFVEHFFGCQDCVQHFLGLSQRRRIFAVNTRDEEILWLWQAHNEVNQRLAGDSTEDPKFPKLQFPSSEVCAECQVSSALNTTWRQSAVLAFLKGIYDVKNLSYYGLPTTNGFD
ncbi:hypothetical protein KR222_004339, partial [Zaprionus bogoriensis]